MARWSPRRVSSKSRTYFFYLYRYKLLCYIQYFICFFLYIFIYIVYSTMFITIYLHSPSFFEVILWNHHWLSGCRSNRPQTKSAPSQIGPSSNRPQSNRHQSNRPQVKSASSYVYKIKWKYRYLTLFFLLNATCLLEKQTYQLLQSLVWHIISYWKMILCLFLVANARVPSVILSNWSAVLSGQIDVPYVYKPLAIMNFRECFNKCCYVGTIWEFLVYEVVDLKEFDLCLLYLIDNRE